jgi:glycerophosphoryl diester phosphodiesterase
VEFGMKSILIGHRGEPASWPENSYKGFEAVLRAGAQYIETDVQITADGVAVLSHDPSLLRITGHNLVVTNTEYREIQTLSAGHPDRFVEKYKDLVITRLDEFVVLLKQWAQARAFIEIKHASIVAFGVEKVVDTVLAILEDVFKQVTIISFDFDALVYTRKTCDLPIGWVLPAWSAENRSRARELSPEYLFCNRKRLPPLSEAPWDGCWKWVVYTVNEINEVAPFIRRGMDMLETNKIRALLAGPAPRGEPGD